MKQKKWMTSLLCSTILFGGIAPTIPEAKTIEPSSLTAATLEKAMEEATISKAEAIKLATEAVTIPKGFNQDGVTFQSNWRGSHEVWRIEWRKQTEGHHQISVTINAETGDVVGMNIWSDPRNDNVSFPPKVTYDEAIKIAKAYISELYPNKLKQIILDEETKKRSKIESVRRGYHNILFYEEINGVPFRENSIRLTVTGNGNIRNFHYNWLGNVEFEDANDILSQNKVNKIIEESLTMELRYQYDHFSQRNGNEKARVVYAPKKETYHGYLSGSYGMMDAETGKWIDHNGEVIKTEKEISKNPVAVEATPLQVRKKELSQDEAYDVIEKSINLPKELVLENARYHENWGNANESVWSFDWRKKGEPIHGILRAEVHAKTGELLRYSNHRHHYPGEDQDFEVNVTKSEALNIATNFVKEAAADKVDRLYATSPTEQRYNNEEKPRSYNVRFVRKENGLPVEGQGVNVTISTETGEITSFRTEWNNSLQFPSVTNVISQEKAKKVFLKNMNLVLNYFVPNQHMIEGDVTKQARVVYQPNMSTSEPVYLDALSGKWVNRETGKPIHQSEKIIDIEGHWAQKDLKKMVDYQIFEAVDGKLHPNKAVTNAEMIEYILKSLGFHGNYYNRGEESPYKDISKDDDFYPYIQHAYERGLINTESDYFYPDQEVDREDFAILIIKALGYNKLASVEDLFDSDFKDISKIDKEGHVALVEKLGIMQGDQQGYFNPDQTLTKAEAATTILKFMEQRSKLKEKRYY